MAVCKGGAVGGGGKGVGVGAKPGADRSRGVGGSGSSAEGRFGFSGSLPGILGPETPGPDTPAFCDGSVPRISTTGGGGVEAGKTGSRRRGGAAAGHRYRDYQGRPQSQNQKVSEAHAKQMQHRGRSSYRKSWEAYLNLTQRFLGGKHAARHTVSESRPGVQISQASGRLPAAPG